MSLAAQPPRGRGHGPARGTGTTGRSKCPTQLGSCVQDHGGWTPKTPGQPHIQSPAPWEPGATHLWYMTLVASYVGLMGSS